MTYRKLIATSLLTICVCMVSNAQDIEETINTLQDRITEDPLKITGTFNATGQYYQAFQIDNRALPFAGRLMAALNFDFLGIQMPLSLAYSNGGLVFNKRLPSFSFFGISPSYKWAKVHIGTRSMDFGKFSFNKHSFNGIGLELSPDKWLFSAFYGRLRRARVQDLQGLSNVDPFFRRWAFGSKVGYENDRDRLSLSIFKAWDDEQSIPQPVDILDFDPSENVIISGQFSKGIGERMDLEVEYAHSGFTANRRQERSLNGLKFSNFLGLLNRNLSTRYNNAFEGKLKYRLKRIVLDLAYERIDPGYRTMGALFFNNDLENISAGLKFRFFKGRLNIVGRSGIQRNNLQDKESNDYKRFVGSMNVNILASKKLTLSAQISNFNIANRRTLIIDPTSPILFTDLVVNNRQGSFIANYVITNNNSRSSTVLISSSFSQGNTVLNDEIQEDQSSTFTNILGMYTIELKPIKWSFTLNSSYSANTFSTTKVGFSNLGFATDKYLLKDKLAIGLLTNFALNRSYLNELLEARGRLINVAFTLSFATSPTSSLSFNSGYLTNQAVDSPGMSTSRTFSEFRNTLNFQYRFNPRGK